MVQAKTFLKVYQIYYNELQKEKLDYIPYLNKDCTPFFENSVIADLIKNNHHQNCEYFGVVSHKLKEKIGVIQKKWKNASIANHSLNNFSKQQFEYELRESMPDCMSFQRHKGHDPITHANNFHPGFSSYFKEIMKSIGYNWTPEKYDNVFYCNFFVAKSNIYEDYVNKMLIPAMDVIKNMPELMNNSYYPHALPDYLKAAWGVNHYPYHTFLCERMFSFYAQINKLKCLHY